MPTVVLPTNAVQMCASVVPIQVTSNSIPQTTTTTPINTKRQIHSTIVTPPPQVSVQQAPLALTTTQARSPQPAHQQPPLGTIPILGPPVTMIPLPPTTTTTATTNNRPPTSLTIMKTPPGTGRIMPVRSICSLIDNGIRCDRVATNASFSARIQKLVASKKMNLTHDSSAKHQYICEHHKAILAVAKKSTATPKDNKANAKNNYNAAHNNNCTPNTLNNQPQPPPMVNYTADLSMMPGVMAPHPVSIVALNNQERIAINNHSGPTMNNIPMRPGPQIAYTHYPGPQANQMGNMDVMMSTSFDQAGGDSISPRNNSGVDVDLQQLQVNTLRRYKKHFRVPTRPGLNKMQLAEALKCHFRTLPIIEKEAITYFVYIAKCYLNKLDHVA